MSGLFNPPKPQPVTIVQQAPPPVPAPTPPPKLPTIDDQQVAQERAANLQRIARERGRTSTILTNPRSRQSNPSPDDYGSKTL